MEPRDIFANATAPESALGPLPRTLVVVAHPDDETIALGARLARFGDAQFIHVTDGAPRVGIDSQEHGFDSPDAYRRARVSELDEVFRLSGIPDVSRRYMEIADQEAALHLVDLSVRLSRLFQDCAPEAVFTHPYEGGHPDHDACAFAVHHAANVQRRLTGTAPVLIEAAFYHLGSEGIETGAFLPEPRVPGEMVYELSAEEQERKRERLNCFVTQRETLKYFRTDVERFRIAPAYDFKMPPHSPPLFYDGFSWGMTSQKFCELADEAEYALKQQEALITCR